MNIKTIAIAAVAALSIAACGGSGNWEEDLRAEIRSDPDAMMTQEDCDSLAFFGIDSPQAFTIFAGGFIDLDTKISDLDDTGLTGGEDITPVDLVAVGLPMNLTVGEALNVAFDEMMSECDFPAA